MRGFDGYPLYSTLAETDITSVDVVSLFALFSFLSFSFTFLVGCKDAGRPTDREASPDGVHAAASPWLKKIPF